MAKEASVDSAGLTAALLRNRSFPRFGGSHYMTSDKESRETGTVRATKQSWLYLEALCQAADQPNLAAIYSLWGCEGTWRRYLLKDTYHLHLQHWKSPAETAMESYAQDLIIKPDFQSPNSEIWGLNKVIFSS